MLWIYQHAESTIWDCCQNNFTAHFKYLLKKQCPRKSFSLKLMTYASLLQTSLLQVLYYELTLFITLMILKFLKLQCRVTFVKYLASRVSLFFLPKTLFWNTMLSTHNKFADFSKAGGKWAKEDDLPKQKNIHLGIQYTTAKCRVLEAYNYKGKHFYKHLNQGVLLYMMNNQSNYFGEWVGVRRVELYIF